MEVYQPVSATPQKSWLCMSAIPSVCLRITWYFGLMMHPGPIFIIGRSPWTQQSTFHHGSLTRWFSLCSTARHLFKLWDRAVSWMPLALLVVSSPLSAVFIIGCYWEGLFHVPLAFGTHERRTGSLVREHVLPPISTKSWSSCFVPRADWWEMPQCSPFNGSPSIDFNSFILDTRPRVLWVPWGLQSLVAGSLAIDRWEYINVSWSMDLSGVRHQLLYSHL